MAYSFAQALPWSRQVSVYFSSLAVGLSKGESIEVVCLQQNILFVVIPVMFAQEKAHISMAIDSSQECTNSTFQW